MVDKQTVTNQTNKTISILRLLVLASMSSTGIHLRSGWRGVESWSGLLFSVEASSLEVGALEEGGGLNTKSF